MKVLITGANGMLGQDLVLVFEAGGYEVLKTDREELDITNEEAVMEYVERVRPDVVVNAAAYNFVDKAEEPEEYKIAFAVNAEGPRNLARAAKAVGTTFVHYSTDYVFAGDNEDGYSEEDVVSPISKYGESKAAGEEFVKEVGGDYYICRLSKIFGNPGAGNSKESFVALMLRLAEKMPSLKIVDEEVGCPSYTPDIASTTLYMLKNRLESGVYHIVNEGEGVTWYEFAKEIFDIVGVETPSEPVSSDEFPKPAKRPRFAALKNTKLLKLRDRKEALREFLGK